MNELTEAATRRYSGKMMNNPWVTPALLAFLSVASVGNYSAINTGNDALRSLNASVAETNRLAEMRGATQVEISTLRNEVEKLRISIAKVQTIENSQKDFDTLRKVILTLRDKVDETSSRAMVIELTKANRDLIMEISKTLDSFATHRQLDAVIGRIDAISRRTSGPTQSQ